MTTARFLDICIDASSSERLAPFWAAALGYDLVRRADGPASLKDPASGLQVWVNEVPEPRTVKQRVHLDVHCRDVQDLVDAGATVERAPTEDEPWWSLLDPEGGELCGFVRDEPPAQRLYEIVVDSRDHRAQADWWGEVFGVQSRHGQHGSYLEGVTGFPGEFIVFGTVPEPKTVKNRVHWDVRCADLDVFLERGATVLREPIPDEHWHVLADREGNEFCVFPAE